MKINKKTALIFFALTLISCVTKKNNEKINIQENKLNKQNLSNLKNKLSEIQEKEIKKNNTFYFEFDKYQITTNQTKILDKHINFIKQNNINNITIEGHTDEIGSSEYNIALGERRAKSIKMYLESQGINSEIISIISYGKEKPISIENNKSANSKNRRAVIKY